jgi:molybdenum cofactor biosynthesis enzyme MoaA
MEIFDKNYVRKHPTFANINLFGVCNINCYFCLGQDLPQYFGQKSYDNIHYSEWENFDRFLLFCQEHGINNLYLTGQNTDPHLYQHLVELIKFLQDDMGFNVGIRTNGFGAIANLDLYNSCRSTIGYSAMSLDYNIHNKITGVYDIPDWRYIIPRTKRCRVSIVINRYNFIETMKMIEFFAQFQNVKYIQLRRVSTDTRQEELALDAEIFEHVYQSCLTNFKHQFKKDFYGAPVLNLFGKEITFWRTVKTDINSFNYYTDGVFTDEYFIVEGYLKAKKINCVTT